MIVIVTLLLLVSAILLLLGLIKPKLIKFKSRKKVLFMGIPIIVVLFVTGLIITPELTPEQRLAAEERREERALEKERKQQENEQEKVRKQQEKEEAALAKEDDEKEKLAKAEENNKSDNSKATEKDKNEKTGSQTDYSKKEEAKVEITLTTAENIKDFNQILKKSYDKIENVQLDNDIVIIVYGDRALWSETSAFESFATDSIVILRSLSNNNNINGVGFAQMMTMIDQKGNNSVQRVMLTYFDKENYDDINFSNFTGLVYGDPSRFYSMSNGYWIHPSIYMNLDEEKLNNLPFTPNNTTEGFETVSEITIE